jgi:hypothetical protein
VAGAVADEVLALAAKMPRLYAPVGADSRRISLWLQDFHSQIDLICEIAPENRSPDVYRKPSRELHNSPTRLLSRHRERPTAPGRSLFWEADWKCGARLPRVKNSSRRTRVAVALVAGVLSLLFAAPMALADNGVGLAGPTTDKTVTFFCFGVIVFFAVLVIVLSLAQGRLEKRKERRRYDLERFG